MYKFFVEENQIINNEIHIVGIDWNHISNVLRMKIGEKIQITNKNNSDTYECSIAYITNSEVICDIIKKEETILESKVQVDLYQGIPKSDKMEFIIQKSVELGINRIYPVNMKNCIAKIKDEVKKGERWQKISEAAAKQCKRNLIPVIEKSVNMEYIYKNISNYDLVLIAYENEKNVTLKQVLQNDNSIKKLAIIIGPEGGLDKKEVNELIENGAKAVSLGKRILRTETASIAILSMIMYEFDL